MPKIKCSCCSDNHDDTVLCSPMKLAGFSQDDLPDIHYPGKKPKKKTPPAQEKNTGKDSGAPPNNQTSLSGRDTGATERVRRWREANRDYYRQKQREYMRAYRKAHKATD